jgi:hypothetical protein
MGCAVLLSELFFGLRERSLGGVAEADDALCRSSFSPSVSCNVGIVVVAWVIVFDTDEAEDEDGGDTSIGVPDRGAIAMDVCRLKKSVRENRCF